MIARLVALWFTIGVMWLSAASCYAIGAKYYRLYAYEQNGEPMLPNISALFMTQSGWIYFYPGLFILAAAWLTWKARVEVEWIWCFVATSLGTMILFLTLFNMAVEVLKF